MDADGLPLVGPGVDYTKVEAIHQKRTIAFINHFITHTASFLNRFSGVCEQKLETLSNRIQQLEISMQLLEAKLSSIPGLENVTVAPSSSSTSTPAVTEPTPVAVTSTTTTAAPASSAPSVTEQSTAGDPGAAAAMEEHAKPSVTVSQHPAYSRFFKMKMVGVPDVAVKLKMSAEGLNPDFLDTPDAPAPEGGGSSPGDGAGNKSDSDDFSDDDNNDDDDEDEEEEESSSGDDFSD